MYIRYHTLHKAIRGEETPLSILGHLAVSAIAKRSILTLLTATEVHVLRLSRGVLLLVLRDLTSHRRKLTLGPKSVPT